MKKIFSFVLALVCILGISGCGKKEDASSLPNSGKDIVQDETVDSQDTGKEWTAQDIISMFDRVREADWEYIDSVLIPDNSSSRVGAVLFRNDKDASNNVAFFDKDGFFQQCGTYAKLAAEPDFAYLGNGAVTFSLEAEDGTIYHYTLTISIDGSNVNFKAEDDLQKQQ